MFSQTTACEKSLAVEVEIQRAAVESLSSCNAAGRQANAECFVKLPSRIQSHRADCVDCVRLPCFLLETFTTRRNVDCVALWGIHADRMGRGRPNVGSGRPPP